MQIDKQRLISIVIPFYKEKKLVSEAIKSVLDQKRIGKDAFQIIVSDEDREGKNKFFFQSLNKDIVYLTNKYQKGSAGNRQTAYEQAFGKYVLFLDQDDILKPNFVSESLRVLEKEKDKVATICLSRSTFKKGFKLTEKLKILPLMIIRDSILLVGYLFNKKSLYPSSFYLCQVSHMLFRRRRVANLSFNQEYKHAGEDWEFVVKALERGGVRIVPERLLLFRYRSTSSRENIENKRKKWKSYKMLASSLAPKYKNSVFYWFFLAYIRIYSRI